MGYEIDFLPVGKGSAGGDAITLRLGDLRSEERADQFVAVIDGGNSSDGLAVVDHIKTTYGTDRVDVVVSTHLDRDHIGGLTTVIEQLNVCELWMNEPDAVVEEDLQAALAEFSGSASQRERLATITASVSDSRGLAERARELDIRIVAPLTGLSAAGGQLEVAGPSADLYASLVPRFRGFRQTQSYQAALEAGLEAKKGTSLEERLDHELLEKVATTSPENESSVITVIRVDGRSVVLTGDAGVGGLTGAADYLDSRGFDWKSLRAIQVPHHGSRNNVTPKVLDRYLGPMVQESHDKKAFVSCPPKGQPVHPSKRVTNAFYRRGCDVYVTAGRAKRHSHDAPARDGFGAAKPLPFYETVE